MIQQRAIFTYTSWKIPVPIFVTIYKRSKNSLRICEIWAGGERST